MTLNIPRDRPKLTRLELHAALVGRFGAAEVKRLGWGDTLIIVGVRGYYRDTMGVVGENDRGLYDDALFLVGPSEFEAFNGNTDPSKFRPGRGDGAGKGMASLKPGIWPAFQFGKHKQQYEALVQTAGKVTVVRDGLDGAYERTGYFGINIHRGGNTTTSSEGCQTIPPDQWPRFIQRATQIGKAVFGARFRTEPVTYVLLDGLK
ncbi:hypothetical protein [Brevundimonas sp.]|uniref:hypothetical protein n=1 Tax=Brevundimonas sp. TaxID=1871086 RepID=UPI003F728404